MTLEEQVKVLLEEIRELKEINRRLEKRIAEQDMRIFELEDLLRKSRINKNSSNSSKPPSTDIFNPKRNQSLREPSGKRPGGQPGHKGTTLEMREIADEIIELNPDYCSQCGCNLEHEESHFEFRRQEFDIPPIEVKVKEYRRNSKTCPKCGYHQEVEFPKSITNNVQYGPNIESAVCYLSVYQYLPFKRLKECLQHFFKLDISEGSIDNILSRMSSKAQPMYEDIRETILESNQVGSDETSVKVKGKKHWIWVWQTAISTFLTASESRGMQAIDSIFPDGFAKGILNTDRWAAQLKTKSAGHQLCISHLLRDLKFIEEVDKIDWSKRLTTLLIKSLELKKEQLEYSKDNPLVMELEQGLDILLKEEIPKIEYNKTHAFQKSLIKHRDGILTFLYNKETPADNNASERAIRNAKIKQKVSGQFKTGQQIFCVLRSVIDTSIKRGIDVWDTLFAIANLEVAE